MTNIESIEQILRNKQSENLFKHSIGVKETALKLSKIYNLDSRKIELAALLHDYAKEMKDQDLLELSKKNNIDLDTMTLQYPYLLHGPVAAVLVKKVFSINDADILEAIKLHTIGTPEMGPAARVVYLADAIEPGRRYAGVEEIREEAFQGSLNMALIMSLKSTIYFLMQNKLHIHPKAIELYNSLLSELKWEG